MFDSDDESGSEDAIKMEEPSSRKKSSSAKSDAIVSKYAKKSVGFTDDNSEWLQLKKEVCILFCFSFSYLRSIILASLMI